jgi:sortase A
MIGTLLEKSPVLVSAGEHALSPRLRIPGIDINARIESVGITASGAMGTPEGPSNVGWWSAGTAIGQVGSAVIDGHFGWKDNIPAVFDNLHTLQVGDRVYVDDGKGVTIVFVVRELRLYGKLDNDAEVFRSSDGKAHLNLITCEGTWNAAEKSYSNRLVVFTDLE